MATLSASCAGSWFLLAFFCLSLLSSLMAHPAGLTKGPTSENQTASLSICLSSSTDLMRELEDSLHRFQETFRSNCTMGQILPNNPHHEEKIKRACIGRKSSKPGLCLLEANDVVDQVNHHCQTAAWCMTTIYTILKDYEVEIKTFNSPKLLNTVNHLMKALQTNHKITEQPPFTQNPLKKTYEKDLNQCQTLLILQQLSQIINRILNYRNSLEI